MVNQQEELKSILEKIQSPNITIIGQTGVGKSTLVNAIFGMEVAKVGAGRAVTQKYSKYSPESLGVKLPVIIYDSPGYEAGKEESEFIAETFRFINERIRKGIEEQIHLVWYVVSAPSARFQEFDIDILNEITKHRIPVIIVLSQCDRASDRERRGIKEAIAASQFNKLCDVIEVSAEPLTLNGRLICEPFGLKELVNKTIELLPEIYSESIILTQIVDIESKREIAWKYISQSAIACFSTGAIPIAFTTPVGAIAAMGHLCCQLTMLYGHSKLGLTLALSGVTVGGLINFFAYSLVDGLSSIFPGISFLSAAAAATYTTVSGMAYAKVCEKLAKQKIYGSQIEIKQFLKETFREEFSKFYDINISSIADLNTDKIRNRYLNSD
ncbi:GTPase family protein [Fischerella sp. PCC 9605]|uniref:GTPase family protein n=1 Tax=Fischerella sp. PCC 9605 TaxID=1173024 RepID=UPI0004B4B780|nr:GTPase domain-containing protein [Fischerella sp. PCC 9605]